MLPLSVSLPRKKGPDRIWILNLNSYRNTHYQILNQAKIAWKQIVADAIYRVLRGNIYEDQEIKPITEQARFVYTVFPANNRAFDLGNVLPVVQKFTDDALIELGIIKDDNYKIVAANDHRFGGVDKANPRVELEITRYLNQLVGWFNAR